mmetsp:Transcript_25947/g.57434  ORF Transcript_25947/g.57434 Transcript_25947/m.57434 type:complete len:155 (+) Transcript_25947:3358-3822(+)
MSSPSSEGSWDEVEPEAPSDLEEAPTEAQQLLEQVSQEMHENIQKLVSIHQKSWFRSIQKLVSLIADAKHEAETLLHDAKSQAENVADQSQENTLFAKNEAESSLVWAAEETEKWVVEKERRGSFLVDRTYITPKPCSFKQQSKVIASGRKSTS